MELHVKLVDSEGDAAASRRGHVPQTFLVFGVPVGVVWAAEGARGTREFPTTACKDTRPTGESVRASSALKHSNVPF